VRVLVFDLNLQVSALYDEMSTSTEMESTSGLRVGPCFLSNFVFDQNRSSLTACMCELDLANLPSDAFCIVPIISEQSNYVKTRDREEKFVIAPSSPLAFNISAFQFSPAARPSVSVIQDSYVATRIDGLPANTRSFDEALGYRGVDGSVSLSMKRKRKADEKIREHMRIIEEMGISTNNIEIDDDDPRPVLPGTLQWSASTCGAMIPNGNSPQQCSV